MSFKTKKKGRQTGKINRGWRDLFLCRRSCVAAVFALGKQCVGDKVTEKGGDKKSAVKEKTRVPKTTVKGLDSYPNLEQ